MTVTGIEELTKTRSRVYLDGEYAFVLYKSEIRAYRLQTGRELAEEDYREIMEEILPKRAKLRAMKLLTAREYTTRQLMDKLKTGGYPDEIVEQAIEYVAGYHYIDDSRYAISYISDHESTRSSNRIQQDLMNKGITKQVIQQAFLEYEEQGGQIEEEAQIEEWCRKKRFSPQNSDQTQKRRMYGFLLRKGFPQELVRKAVLGDDRTSS